MMDPSSPLADACAKLEKQVRAREGAVQTSLPFSGDDNTVAVTFPRDYEAAHTTEKVRDQKKQALQILSAWKCRAKMDTRKKAEQDCDFLIKFINSICNW